MEKMLTKEEMQQYVDKVYDYAVDLCKEGYTLDEVETKLVNQGLSKEDASVVVSKIVGMVSHVESEQKSAEIGCGLVGLIGSIVVCFLIGRFFFVVFIICAYCLLKNIIKPFI